jgi:hypothetical protein
LESEEGFFHNDEYVGYTLCNSHNLRVKFMSQNLDEFVEEMEAPRKPVKEEAKMVVRKDDSVTAGFVSWMCLVTSICTILILFFGLKFANSKGIDVLGAGGGASAYVIVDEVKLYELKLQGAISRPGMSVERAQEDAARFKDDVETAIKSLAANGKIVLTKQAVLAGGESLDVTEQIAVNLGLK